MHPTQRRRKLLKTGRPFSGPKTFAVIDVANGFVVGCVATSSPTHACTTIQLQTENDPTTFHPVSAALARRLTDCLAVYEVLGDYVVANGQDSAEITVIKKFPFVGYFRPARDKVFEN